MDRDRSETSGLSGSLAQSAGKFKKDFILCLSRQCFLCQYQLMFCERDGGEGYSFGQFNFKEWYNDGHDRQKNLCLVIGNGGRLHYIPFAKDSVKNEGLEGLCLIETLFGMRDNGTSDNLSMNEMNMFNSTPNPSDNRTPSKTHKKQSAIHRSLRARDTKGRLPLYSATECS